MRADFGRCTARSECVLVQEYNGTSAGGVCSPPWRRLRCRHPPARTTSYVTQWGSFGTGTGEFDTPGGIDTDSHDNVYVADFGNERVQKFGSDGEPFNGWGNHRQRHARPPHRRGGGQPRQRVRGGRRARPRGEARLDRRLRASSAARPARSTARPGPATASSSPHWRRNGLLRQPVCRRPGQPPGAEVQPAGTFQWAFGGSAAGPRRSIPRASTSAAAARSMSPTRATTAWSAGT